MTVHQAIHDVAANEGRVLLAAPTRRLAATMREKFPDLEIDTVHGAFLVYKPVQERVLLGWLRPMLAVFHSWEVHYLWAVSKCLPALNLVVSTR